MSGDDADGDRLAVTTDEVWPDDAEEEEGVVTNWFTSEGGQIAEGDTLCEIQVEKVSVDVPAPVDGIVDEIVLEEDDEFERGDTLAILEPS